MRSASNIYSLIRYECLQTCRHSAELFNPLFFFIIVVSLFPLAIGAEPNLLRSTAPGIIWVAALLATLLSQERLFARNWQEGSLDGWILSPQPLSILVLAKTAGHWLITGLPLIVITPVLGVLFDLDSHTLGVLLLSLLLGTPILSFIGSIAAALLIGVRGGGMLLPLLLLPLYIPVLVFAVLAVKFAASGENTAAPLALLAALLLLSVALAPLATSSALKIGAE